MLDAGAEPELQQEDRRQQRHEITGRAIDEVALALLYLTLHDRYRAWKGFDWDVLNRLHERGFIEDPVNKTKSVVFIESHRLDRTGDAVSQDCSDADEFVSLTGQFLEGSRRRVDTEVAQLAGAGELEAVEQSIAQSLDQLHALVGELAGGALPAARS